MDTISGKKDLELLLKILPPEKIIIQPLQDEYGRANWDNYNQDIGYNNARKVFITFLLSAFKNGIIVNQERKQELSDKSEFFNI